MADTTMKGNTLLPPGRLTGDEKADVATLNKFCGDLYDRLVKTHNVLGKTPQMEADIAALKAVAQEFNDRIKALESK